ncbi:MAG TPA: trypsin-like peptidase domain-containing protein [Lacisediminihabitans sp.]|uniref:S1C family serine protease n=1 Tax=Lacisediminihabitans sp. TaxID=2787631 RepID=UPI002EDA429B
MNTEDVEPDAAPESPTAAEAARPASRRRWRRRTVVIVGAVGALAIVCGAGGIATSGHLVAADGGTSSSGSAFGPAATTPRSTASRASSLSALSATDAQQVGVVTITTVLGYQEAEAAGTGIVLSSSGEIVTNNHVVDGATSISVTVVSTGAVYTADVVGTDPTDDIAVLRLEGASGLKTATLDTDADAAVADAVTAVGNAGGTGELTRASGAITALDQTITASDEDSSNAETLTGLIQTDADVQAGDSGGPLYDAEGEVIGIDTAASSGGSETEGFAIPIGKALAVASLIEAGGETSGITIGYPAFLGVETSASSGEAGIDSASIGSAGGAAVIGVVAGTPAAGIGLVAGDTITAIDGTAVPSAAALSTALGDHAAGDTVTLSWTDAAGTTHDSPVTLAQGPAN